MHGLGRWASTSFAGGGLGVALRSQGRERVGFSATVGSLEGVLAGRGELLLGYYLNPQARSGLSPYAVGGAALEVTGAGHQGFVVLAVGVESAPAEKLGWFLEAGIGGGLRGMLGLRWRHRHS